MYEGDNDRHCLVHFLGVWDTVSSVGWVWNPESFPYTARNPSIARIRHAVSMDETIQADVPLEALGIANGVKNFGGLLEQSLRSLAIECFPRDLPDRITVDVSELNIGDSIHVRQIQLPPGVTSKVLPDLTAFSVLAPVVEEEPVVAEAEAAAAGPEVIKEKKEEGETAAPAAKETAPKEKATPREKEQKK